MRKKTARILTGIAILVVALGVLYGIAVGISAYRLRQAYAALQREGRPMNVADIVPPQVPDSENAALLYESAALLLKAQPAQKENLLRHLGGLSVEYLRGTADPNATPELEQLLRTDVVNRALTLVEQGAERPSCRFDVSYGDPMALRTPHLSYVRDFAWILGVKAFLESKAGHSDDAWRAVQTQLKLANALRAEPMVVNQLVRATMVDATCTTIQMLCRVTPPTLQQVRDAEQLFKGFDSIDPLVRAADGERLIFGEWLFGLPKSELSKEAQDYLQSKHMPDILHQLLYWRMTFKPLLLADHAAFLEWSRKYVHLLQDPDVLDKTDAFTKEFYSTQKHHFITYARAPAAAAKTTGFHYSVVAAVRITLIGLTLLQYKRAHGDFPESLDALSVQNVEDPFSRKPLIYRREGGGFILYSIGQDRKDNGGTPRQPKRAKEYDIVWRFPDDDQTTPSSGR